jgi:murein DD-endopeptidase MepM/ murein hydrolase activator NlpD
MLVLSWSISQPATIPTPAAGEPALYAVTIGGQYLGLVTDAGLPGRLLADLVEHLQVGCAAPLVVTSPLEVLPVDPAAGAEPLGPQPLLSALARAAEVMAEAAAICVNDREAVVVASEAEATAVLSRLRAAVLDVVAAAGNAEVLGMWVRETLSVRATLVPPALIRDVESAIQVLLRGTDRILVHKVQRGQSLWSIAQAHNLTVDELRRANPEVRSDVLQVGQVLNLVVAEPYVTVETVERRSYREEVAFDTEVRHSDQLWPWEEKVERWGVPGLVEITVEIVRENGRELERTVLERTVLREPVTQIIVRGTRAVPSRGTGDYVWPVHGRITSRFGWRALGWHSGVDIGAVAGTPILAAASGVVTFAAYAGNYGNKVVIDHGVQGGDRIATVYGHLSRFAVSVGAEVSAGQVIGYVGSTGRSTGPHLHFEVRINGQAVDPIRFYQGL